MSDYLSITDADLASCDREPIHIPGSIQPHGVLVCLDPATLEVVQVSKNIAELLGIEPGAAIGEPLRVLMPALERDLSALPDIREGPPQYLNQVELHGKRFDALAHRSPGGIVLELELCEQGSEFRLANLYAPLEQFLASSRAPDMSPAQLSATAAAIIADVTGFDRVLVYQFDSEWNGNVIAEYGNGRLPSYLGLRFPASDIPSQARELYRKNRIRIISDVNYTPVPLEPLENRLTRGPLDLSFSTLRSVSPVHLEYMRNMGTAASMSFSLLRDRELWGLICCHNREPKRVGFQQRSICDLLAQILSLELAALERSSEAQHLLALEAIQSRLLRAMAASSRFHYALAAASEDLLGLTNATGAAILHDGELLRVGETPHDEQIFLIADFLQQRGQPEVFSTHALAALLPEAESFRETAAGLLAISLSKLHRNYLMWFRPERIRTIAWGGDPGKIAVYADGARRLSPRKSFEAWSEMVRLESDPWRRSEITAATELRNAVVGIVFRRAEELAQLNAELERSNRELEAFSYSVSHDLRAPLRHIAGYAELLAEESGAQLSGNGSRYLAIIRDSVEFAGKLVDNLLHFSRLGRNRLVIEAVNLNEIVHGVREDLQMETGERRVQWKIQTLPEVKGDAILLGLVWRNLISNALKFTRNRPVAQIEIGWNTTQREAVFFIRDNGVGFDMQFASKLFGVFERLHRMDQFEGTGIGLANVRRIIERHGGRTWAEAEVDKGATFYFSLPIQNVTSLASKGDESKA
jgi:chemotaxis family two-component system sensor kinase Cph1